MFSFAVCTLWLRGVLPPFELPGTSVKLEEVRRGEAEIPYDTLFLGSSRTWRSFDPEIFDERVAGAGGVAHSFNFGIQGMAAVGSWQLLERLAEAPPRGLKRILIDPEALYKEARGRNPLARGIIGWHTPHATSILCRLAWSVDAPLDDRLQALADHLHSCLYNVSNAGRGARSLAHWLGTDSPRRSREFLGPRGRGFVAFPQRHAARFHPGSTSWEHFLRRRDSFRAPLAITGELTPAGRELFSILIDRTHALGAELVFVLGPSINHQRQLIEAHDLGELPYLLALNRADLYPELYETLNRYDAAYLNADGAVHFSQYLGDRFGELLDEWGRER